MTSAYYTVHCCKDDEIVKFNDFVCEKIFECENKKCNLVFINDNTKYIIKYNEKNKSFEMTIINLKSHSASVYFTIGNYEQMAQYGKYMGHQI